MSQMNRREFVTTVAAVAAGACLACAGDLCFAGEIEPAAPVAGAGSKLDVGTAADYAKDGLYDKFARSDKVIVVRQGDKIRALSATCTHKAAIVTVKGQEIVCPKHGSRFTADGKNSKGPATAPLFHLSI